MPGVTEWIVVVLIILLLFGAKKIPELARGLGQGINEFRKASTDIRKEIEKGQRDIENDINAAKKDEAVKDDAVK